jgi:putative methyltransferase (TIGR04325 family)
VKRNLYHGYFTSLSVAHYSNEEFSDASNQDIYGSEIWQQRQMTFLQNARKGQMSRHSSLPNLIESAPFMVDVIDYGAGSGWLGSLLNFRNQKKLSKYIGVELEANVFAFSKNGDDSNVKLQTFKSFIESWRGDPKSTVLYSNSVIQYTELVELREVISKVHPNYILLDDVKIASGEKFYTLQNYYGRNLLVRFRNLLELIYEVGQNDYEVILIDDYPIDLNPGISLKIAHHEEIVLKSPKTVMLRAINGSPRIPDCFASETRC